MPLNSSIETRDENGVKKETLVITFTNGAREQIEELKKFFKEETELSIIKLGISVLQRIKETEDAKKVGKDGMGAS